MKIKSINYFLIVYFITAFLFLYCSLKKPESPSFETEINIPISSKSYKMKELADEEENLYVDENNNFGFLVEGELDTIKAIDVLKYDDELRANSAFEIGVFKINATDTIRDSSLTIADFWEPASQNNGNRISVVPFDFLVQANDNQPFDFPEFLSLDIDTGLAVVSIENNLGIPLGLPIALTLKDQQANNQVIVTVDFENPLLSGQKVYRTIDLTGKEISNKIIIEIAGSSPGSDGELVAINLDSQKILINFSVSSITAEHAIARIPELVLYQSDWLELVEEDNQITMIEGEFEQCYLNLTVTSYLSLNSHFDLIFEHIVDQANVPLQIPISLGKNETVELQQNLEGWFLKSDVSQGESNPRIQIIADGITESTGEQMAAVSSNDSISVVANMNDVKMKYVIGSINRKKVEMDTTEQEIDFNYNIPDVKFRETEVLLDVYNKIAFPLELNITFLGSKNSGEQQRYEFRQKTIEPAFHIAGTEKSESVTSFVINDESFDQLINLSPDMITVGGNALVGRYGFISRIDQDDYIFGKYTLRAPLEISFEDTVINFDTTYIQINPIEWDAPKPPGIDYELAADITNNIVDGEIWAVFENKVPIAADAIIRIDTTLERVFQRETCLIMKSGGIRSGVLNEKGIVQTAAIDTISFPISETEMNLFKNDSENTKTVYIGLQMHLKGSNGEYVKIYPDDYLAIKQSYFRIRYEISNDD